MPVARISSSHQARSRLETGNRSDFDLAICYAWRQIRYVFGANARGRPPQAAGAQGTVTYGLNFQAWCVFLMVMHHVPVERCADIIESMSGTRPSDGWVRGLLARAAQAAAAEGKAIRALIILARVICGDEPTGQCTRSQPITGSA